MPAEHNSTAAELAYHLRRQLDTHAFRVRTNAGHVRRGDETYYIPDVLVIPADVERAQRGTHTLEVYAAPLPLVVEVWSRSTGDYDVDAKLPEYERRGDLEIWRIHPYDRTLIARRRRVDGSYTETTYRTGSVEPNALPGVTIDLDALFE